MEELQNSLEVTAVMDNLERVIEFVEKDLQEASCPEPVAKQICVSLEEIFVNIVNYAYDKKVGGCLISSRLFKGDNFKKYTLVIDDTGKAFNPLSRKLPDITLPIEKRKTGGLGILIVLKSMDEVQYDNNSGHNILTMSRMWQM